MHISTNDLHCCKPARLLQLAPSGGRPKPTELDLYLNFRPLQTHFELAGGGEFHHECNSGKPL
jgi:hypothetical protein